MDAAVRREIEGMAAGAGAARDGLLLLAAQDDLTKESWMDFMAQRGVQQADMRKRANRVANKLGLPRGAKPRILEYLRHHLATPVDKDELSGVSGIYEWGRRVRELRVEDGWPISSNANRDDLKPGVYVLEGDEPDAELAKRWRVANTIRRKPGSGIGRMLDYFKANVGKPVSKDELRYVSRIQEHPRRVRELAEAGWQIESNLDRTDLRPGEYVMTSLERLPAHARQYIKLRYEILTRDDYRCQDCGNRAGAGRRLQAHHIKPVLEGGKNDPDNLVTLCDACHAGRHAMSATEMKDDLLNPEAETPLASA